MIREIKIDELPLIYPIGHAIWKEGKLPGAYVNEIFRASWEKLYAAGVGVIFAAFRGGELVGALGAITYNDLNDGVLVSTEAFWYVFEDFRKILYGYGVRLLIAYEKWAKRRGVKRVGMANLVALNDGPMQSLYEKMGYRPLDRTYIKEVA